MPRQQVSALESVSFQAVVLGGEAEKIFFVLLVAVPIRRAEAMVSIFAFLPPIIPIVVLVNRLKSQSHVSSTFLHVQISMQS